MIKGYWNNHPSSLSIIIANINFLVYTKLKSSQSGGKSMYHSFSEEELRSLCRTHIESLEMWARRLIHEKLFEKYGPQYVDYKTSEENYLIKKDVRDHIHKMLKKEPSRFLRPVDTLFFEHTIYFLCHPRLFQELFQDALKSAYPDGINEMRTFLNRLTEIRNALSHANPISVHQAEQAICYSQDFIYSLKEYYKAKGEEEMWNIPRIIRVSDSLGNVYENPTDIHIDRSIFTPKQELFFGDTYSVSIDVDSSFSPTEYDIIWKNQNHRVVEFDNKRKFIITFKETDVSQSHSISCTLISHESWHKYQYHDCIITLLFPVFPPN